MHYHLKLYKYTFFVEDSIWLGLTAIRASITLYRQSKFHFYIIDLFLIAFIYLRVLD